MKAISRWTWPAVALGALLLAGGCAVVESESVETSGIWAHFVVDHHHDDRVVAWAVLRVGGQTGTIVKLTGGDLLECNGVRMTEYVELITNMHWYRAAVSPAANENYEFSLVRPRQRVDTYLYTPALPIIISTSPASSAGPGDQILVIWDHGEPGDHVNFLVSGACIVNMSDIVEVDDGYHRLPALEDLDPLNPSSCTITVELRRVAGGAVASQYRGGYTEAKRIDAVPLNYR